MIFSEIDYTRVEENRIRDAYESLTCRMEAAGKAKAAESLILEHEAVYKGLMTMGTLAEIRHSLDTRDGFYKAEKAYYDEMNPLFFESILKFQEAVLGSPHRRELEKRFGSLWFTNMELERKTFRPEIIPLLQEENRLASVYQELIAKARIPFDGKTLNLSQLSAYKEAADRDMRRKAYLQESSFFMEHARELDGIFDDLVRVRTEAAGKLGMKEFTPLGYLRMTRNCYGPSEVSRFRREILSEIVPLVFELKKVQARRIGVEPLKLWDDLFSYPEGNPAPLGNPEDILKAGGEMYHGMSEDTGTFISFMLENQLLDVITREGKAAGGYCTELPDFKAPFIFANFNGTSGDVDVLTHEAGHAFAAYKSRDFELAENMQPTYEACEVHSMSMEFLAWPWLELFYGKDARRARSMHLESALVFLPYGTMVDEFQHIIYNQPEMTPKQRCDAWLELERRYRPYMDFDKIDFYAEGRGWQRQLHIYQHPFYYIDYCLAQTVALQFWQLSREDWKGAWEKYLAFLTPGGKETFLSLCRGAGLPTPFEEGSLTKIARVAGEQLLGNIK